MSIFNKHIASFATLLDSVNVQKISSNAYTTSYLNHLLQHKIYYLHIYANLLDNVFANLKQQLIDTSFLDFGCGNGLLALFAKHVGFGKVYANDISTDFLDATKLLSNHLQIEIDGFIQGNESNIQSYFSNKQLDVWAGTDVIEHVYNLEKLFTTIQAVNPNIISVFTTASVYENPFQRKKLQKLMLQDELVGSNPLHTTNSPFCGLSFLEIRKQIITNKFPKLSTDEVLQLATQTRGLQEADIYFLIEKYYAAEKQISYKPSDAFNTCDPITGSFTERLLPVTDYKNLYMQHGFNLTIQHGFYNQFEQGMKPFLLMILNLKIRLLGKSGIIIAPFILLIGKKTK